MVSFLIDSAIRDAKKEALKSDFNHNKKPDIIEALDAGEAACDSISKFLGQFTEDEIVSLLVTVRKSLMLPPALAAKFTIEQAIALGRDIAKLPAAVKAVKEVMEHIESGLLHT